jgi:hypothetical protein
LKRYQHFPYKVPSSPPQSTTTISFESIINFVIKYHQFRYKVPSISS